MPTETTRSDDRLALLADELDADAAARGAVYAVLATTTEQPSRETYDALADGTFEAELRRLVDHTSLTVPVATLATADDYETLCARFNDLFHLGNSTYRDRSDGTLDAEGPPVSPYESRYREDVSWDDVNLDLARAYDYFGLAVDESTRRHHDHARLQLEFAGYLCRREAAVGADAASARLDFLHRHLTVLASGMADRVVDEPGTDVYGPLLSFLASFAAADADDLQRRIES
ncbi:MAG: molecular chaperone TorD family protein [Haloarculaceae archaeon]